MHSNLNCVPDRVPNKSRKWHHRKSGMSKHKKAKKERRRVKSEIHLLTPEAVDLFSINFEKHSEALRLANINQPTKRNGSAKSLRDRHKQRSTKKIAIGNSGWKIVHGPLV